MLNNKPNFIIFVQFGLAIYFLETDAKKKVIGPEIDK